MALLLLKTGEKCRSRRQNSSSFLFHFFFVSIYSSCLLLLLASIFFNNAIVDAVRVDNKGKATAAVVPDVPDHPHHHGASGSASGGKRKHADDDGNDDDDGEELKEGSSIAKRAHRMVVLATKLAHLIGKKGADWPMEIRLIVARKQVKMQNHLLRKEHQSSTPKMDITMVTDGRDKCQLQFPSEIKFKIDQEFTLKRADVHWSHSGVLSLTVRFVSESDIVLHNSKRIKPFDFVNMDYPTNQPFSVQRSRIEKLRRDDKMIDITLKIVAADIIKVSKDGQRSWDIVGSDGTNFITLRADEKWALEMFVSALGENFIDSIFTFQTFSAFYFSKASVTGDVPLQLKPSDSELSSIEAIPSTSAGRALRRVNTRLYFKQYLKKRAVDERDFTPIKLAELAELPEKHEGLIDVEANIYHVNSKRRRQVKRNGEIPYVVNGVLSSADGDRTRRVHLSAWNFFSDFFDKIILKEWQRHQNNNAPLFVKLKGLELNRSFNDGLVLVFGYQSRITLVSPLKEVPETLEELAGKRGTCQMEIRLNIAREPIEHNATTKTSTTIVTDGVDKCRLIFPSAIAFEVDEEFTLIAAEVIWNASGVLTLKFDWENMIERHCDDDDEQQIKPYDFADMDYPPSEASAANDDHNAITAAETSSSMAAAENQQKNAEAAEEFMDWTRQMINEEEKKKKHVVDE